MLDTEAFARDQIAKVRNALWGKSLAYKQALDTPAGKIVLRDLVRFCNGNRSSVRVSPVMQTIDPLALAVAEGRREVLLRIAAQLNLSYDDVLAIGREADE